MATLSRQAYAEHYGPTKGDLVRLGDTELFAEIEHDFTVYGHELLIGAGKNLRDGEGINGYLTSSDKILDIVIKNATIIDAVAGIIKADIGIRDGRIVGIGKAGNPDVMPGVHPDMIVGQTTSPVSGAGFIVTAGAIESHAHLGSPEQSDHALSGGTTTMIGNGPGPLFDVGSGSTATFGRFLQATEFSPLNYALFGRGSSNAEAVEESVAAGAMAVKIHEDFGAAPSVIDQSLMAADRNDFAVHLHTDSINEFGFCEDTMDAIDGRTIHMYHVEGAGGGHAPDLLKVVSYDNVIPSSTNPTNPYTSYGMEEGVPMAMICHQLNYNTPEDVVFGESRVRAQTMAAEDFLHDMGAISIFGTDTQGMGRLAENVANCWQLASVMKERIGRRAEETTAKADNERIKRYIAKLTINPAIAVGIDDHVGSIAVGKMADLVLWPRASFGIKPYMVIKNGFIVWAAMGDGNGSLGLAEPMIQKRMWGALGAAPAHLGVNFVSKLAREADVGRKLGLVKQMVPIKSVRKLRKTDMVRNAAMPHVEVDPQTFEVRADGALLMCPPARKVPLSRRYMLR
ncbi:MULTISPECIES: urease subunit alpha [Rhizobium]|uniref:Urease subunit alpha n=1 Tax=Rhizobium rhododendri TaxID=2506430 RepID=A0ABY8IS31_9HYPH|nr:MULTISPECIES: urease subunit alpha [Rhizobium]TQX85231.1 urease subunit alpha [Rhizobium sp. rho-13.1]TQY09519.1 urease subunit alpha [Rhizobium sp. rho-1.1]WFS26003.1 urease subunit alpha [Rhizobium rhododendri]